MKFKAPTPIIKAVLVAVIMAGIGWIGLDIPQSAVEETVDQQFETFSSDATAERSERESVDVGPAQPATVIGVIDGDTAVALVAGEEERLRFIGIDTPETPTSPAGVECYWSEASDRAEQLLGGAELLIRSDPTQDVRDRHGRLLVFAMLPSGIDFGETMVLEGLAREYTYDNPYQLQAAYQAAERSAQAAGRGLWGACD